MSHTSGPWSLTEVMDDEDGLYRQIRAGRLNEVAIADVIVDSPEGESNATLILAAPELLEAGDNLVDAVSTAFETVLEADVSQIVRDAIKEWMDARQKAEGRLTAQERRNA